MTFLFFYYIINVIKIIVPTRPPREDLCETLLILSHRSSNDQTWSCKALHKCSGSSRIIVIVTIETQRRQSALDGSLGYTLGCFEAVVLQKLSNPCP